MSTPTAGTARIGTGHPIALAVIDLGDLPRKEARADGDYSVSRQDEEICGGCGARPALRMLRCFMTNHFGRLYLM
jgi:hypothetical protein